MKSWARDLHLLTVEQCLGNIASRQSPLKPRNHQRGYILAMLLALLAGIGILLTKAMPSVVTEVQREQEEELIFRGEAIKKAISIYKARSGQYPSRLEDLLKVRPRILRKLYKDPMTQEGEWDLITAVQPGATGDMTGLPIVGVRSRCTKDSFKIYNGKTVVNEWTFSAAEGLLGVPGSMNPSQPYPEGGKQEPGRMPPPEKGMY